MHRFAPFAIAVQLLLTTLTYAEGEIPLVNLDAFKGDTGEWQIVGGVTLDPANPAALQSSSGAGVAFNGPKGNTKHLFTKLEHGDVELHIEFAVPKGSNSGVYFQGRYEIQILDSWGVTDLAHSDCGGIYQRWRDGAGLTDEQRGYDGHPPKSNASRPPGGWQSFDVVFRAPRFDADGKKITNAVFESVRHNGILIHEEVEVTGPTRAAAFADEVAAGPLMLQGDHGPVAFRNIRITALGSTPEAP